MCNPVRPYDNSGHGEPIMILAGGLARRIVATRYADLPAEAINYAIIGILDTLGVALAGSREDATATLGVFGAAAACARLLGLSAGQTTTALSLSASFAAGLKSNLGSMAKPLHVEG